MGFLSRINKIWSGADFWDKQENQNQRQQFAREDEEERRRRQNTAASTSLSRPRSATQMDVEIPYKPGKSPNQVPLPTAAFQSDFLTKLKKGPVDPVAAAKSKGQAEIERLTEENLDKAVKEEKGRTSWFDRQVMDRDWIERAKNTARMRANTQYQEKNGFNKQAEVMESQGKIKSSQTALSAELAQQGDLLNKVDKGATKVAQVASYVPVTGSVMNLGLAGTEKLSKGTGNATYGKDLEDKRIQLDLGMSRQDFDKLDEPTRQKLRNLQGVGLAASPLDFLGVGGLAKSGAISAGKKAVLEGVKTGAVKTATKQALKQAAIAEGKAAIVPAVAGTSIAIGGQAYLGGKDAIDPLEALKTGAMVAGTNALFSSSATRNAVEGPLEKASKLSRGVDVGEQPTMPGKIIKDVEEAGTRKVQVSDGVSSTNVAKVVDEGGGVATPRPGKLVPQTIDAPNVRPGTRPPVNVPDPALDPIALAKGQTGMSAQDANGLPVPAIEAAADLNAPLLKANPEQLAPPELGITTRTDVDGNQPLVSDVQATREMADNGYVPPRGDSVIDSREQARTRARAEAEADQVNLADAAPANDIALATDGAPQPRPPMQAADDAILPDSFTPAPTSAAATPPPTASLEAPPTPAPVVNEVSQIGEPPVANTATADPPPTTGAEDIAAPRTRKQAVDLIENESARLDVADTFKTKDTVNIAETQVRATTAVREMSDEGLFAAYRQEPEIKDPDGFFETVAAVERLGLADQNSPEVIRALTNALDGLSSFSNRAGRDLRMVKELFADLPPAMKKQYLIERVEKKLGAELPDELRMELLHKIETADVTQSKFNQIELELQQAKQKMELGVPVDKGMITRNFDEFDRLEELNAYQQGDAFQYSQNLIGNATAGAKVAQASKTAMLASPLRRFADVSTTGIASVGDTTANAIAGVTGRLLNKLSGNAGKYRETRVGDLGALVKGNAKGLKDSYTSLTTDRRKVDDYMGELQKATRSDANNAKRTRGGRLVGDMTEAATNSTQGQYSQRLRELSRQQGQKIGLEGDDLDLYTKITEKIPNEVQKHEASQYHLRTNNLHENKVNTAFRSVASVIEKQFPQAGPIVTMLTVPFKSYQAGGLNRLFTDKTVLGNVGQIIKAGRNGDQQAIVDAMSKAVVNSGEALVVGSVLSSAGLLKDTNDNGEDWSGPYLQTPVGSIPVGFLGPAGINVLVGHNLQKFAAEGDIDSFVNGFGKQALSFMNIEGSLGGYNPLQQVISGRGDVSDRLVKAGGDALRRPIPAFLGDVNAIANTVTGQDKALSKAVNDEGKTDYIKTELNRTVDKLGLSSLLPRDEGKTSSNIIDRITGGTHSSETTKEAEGERNVQKSLKDIEKQFKKDGIKATDEAAKNAIEDGDFETAKRIREYQVSKVEADKNASEKDKARARDRFTETSLNAEGVATDKDGIKARAESGDYDLALRGMQYQYDKIKDDKNTPKSEKLKAETDITRLNVTKDGNFPPEVIELYNSVSNSDWRHMIDPDHEDYNAERAGLLEAYDKKMAEKGVSRDDSNPKVPKYYEKTGGRGRGGGRGGKGARGKGDPRGSADFSTNKISFDDFTPIKAQKATFGARESAIPLIKANPINDTSKLKKITLKRGNRV